jgi:FkbM family methyltransferase
MTIQSHRPVAYTLVSTNQGTLLVNIHDHTVNSGGEHIGVGYQLLSKSEFDKVEVSTVVNLLNRRKQHYGDGVFAIDCGANIGVHTIEWAKSMYGWGEVISIEAQERIFYALAGNITINNCFNARAIWSAVGKYDGYIPVPKPDYFKPSSFGSLEIRKTENTEYIGQDIDYSVGNTQITPMINIDGLKLDRVDFIKIDIEGMEMEALEGAELTITTHKPQMLIERIKSDNNAITNFLLSKGYKIIEFGLNILAIHDSDPTLQEITKTSV